MEGCGFCSASLYCFHQALPSREKMERSSQSPEASKRAQTTLGRWFVWDSKRGLNGRGPRRGPLGFWPQVISLLALPLNTNLQEQRTVSAVENPTPQENSGLSNVCLLAQEFLTVNIGPTWVLGSLVLHFSSQLIAIMRVRLLSDPGGEQWDETESRLMHEQCFPMERQGGTPGGDVDQKSPYTEGHAAPTWAANT